MLDIECFTYLNRALELWAQLPAVCQKSIKAYVGVIYLLSWAYPNIRCEGIA